MKNLIKRHHVATWERGLITPETIIPDFIDKIHEEFLEMTNEYQGEPIPNDEFIHEAVDLVATTLNMLKFYGIDFMEEFRKNVKYQESRCGITQPGSQIRLS